MRQTGLDWDGRTEANQDVWAALSLDQIGRGAVGLWPGKQIPSLWCVHRSWTMQSSTAKGDFTN